MTTHTVYRIVNKVEGKSYIGVTTTCAEERLKQHILASHETHKRKRLGVCEAIREFGKEAFFVETLETVSSRAEALRLESRYIVEFDACNNGYNRNHGRPDQRDKVLQQWRPKGPRKRYKSPVAPIAGPGEKQNKINIGPHLNKGAGNPQSKTYLIKHPDGKEELVTGLKQFCRDHGLHAGAMSYTGRNKGYVILERFNDYPEREYTQAGGSGEGPTSQVA
jgi:predicted GIY-YIG superfamily endonuclease